MPDLSSDYASIETMRLGFLNVGPALERIDLPFTKVTTLYLQHNKIGDISADCF
jgi:hypothetical protein